jgi:hypothetical protein
MNFKILMRHYNYIQFNGIGEEKNAEFYDILPNIFIYKSVHIL